MTDVIPVGESRYAKTVTFKNIQTMDNGNYTCTVDIMGFADNFNVIEVNGKCTSMYHTAVTVVAFSV